MAKKKHLISETFELRGKWWLPGHEDKAVVGNLSYAPERIELDVHGALSTKDAEESPIAALKSLFESGVAEQIKVVHGTTPEGACSLLNFLYSSSNHNFTSTSFTKYSGTFLVLGAHIPSLQVLTSEVRFDATLPKFFFRHHAFEVQPRDDDGNFSVKYSPMKRQVFSICPDDELKILFGASLSETHDNLTIRDSRYFRLVPKHPQPFEPQLAKAFTLCNLFTLLTDVGVVPSQCEARFEDEEDFSRVYFVAAKRFVDGRKSDGPLPLFSFHQIEDSFERCVQRWFSAHGSLQNAIQLFLEGRVNPFPVIEGQFIVLTQAVEAFSRAVGDSKYMSDSEYASLAASVIAAIPSSLDSSHRESLKNRIRFGNEHSLRKRITGLLADLGQEAQELVCKSPSTFAAGVVDTRNYLTHNTEGLRPKAFNGEGMHWAGVRMAVLLRILLLKHIGLAEPMICERIRNHLGLVQSIKRAREYPEATDDKPDAT